MSVVAHALQWIDSVIINPMPEIILASSSEQRKKLLTAAGWQYQVHPATLDEQALVTPPNTNRALYLAGRKAEEVARSFPADVVIAADTIVSLGKDILEKPNSLDQASAMLHQLSGQTFEVHTGVVLQYGGHVQRKLVRTTAQMRDLTEAEINQYVHQNPVTSWSAGFSPAYPAGMALLARVDGSFTALTHGLPLEVISGWLTELGVNVN